MIGTLYTVTDKALDEVIDDLKKLHPHVSATCSSTTRVLLYQLRKAALGERQERRKAKRDQLSMVSP